MAMLVFLNAWLASRLVLTFHDRPLPGRVMLPLLGIQLLLAGMLAPGLPWLLLPGAIVVSLLLSERWVGENWLNEGRLLGLILMAGVVVALHSWSDPALWFLPAASLSPERLALLWGLLGFFLVANEANLVIRVLLHRFRLEPMRAGADDAKAGLDQREYNAGRIIGILERWLIYTVLVVAQNYNVIALVLAAKGFSRFRQLDQREFAEYVLIGTLASTLLTVLTGHLILALL